MKKSTVQAQFKSAMSQYRKSIFLAMKQGSDAGRAAFKAGRVAQIGCSSVSLFDALAERRMSPVSGRVALYISDSTGRSFSDFLELRNYN